VQNRKKFANELKVGEEFEPYEFHVTPELNQQYLYGVEDYHPRYLEETELGLPIVHPALLLNQSNITRSPSFSLPPDIAAVHTADEVEFLSPARVGKRLRVTWKVTDIYEKRGRPYQVVEALIVDEDGVQILRRRSSNTFFERER